MSIGCATVSIPIFPGHPMHPSEEERRLLSGEGPVNLRTALKQQRSLDARPAMPTGRVQAHSLRDCLTPCRWPLLTPRWVLATLKLAKRQKNMPIAKTLRMRLGVSF